MPPFLLRLRPAALLLVLLGFTVTLPACDSDGAEEGVEVTVMTRNLYLGGDLFVLLDASSPAQVPGLVGGLYADVIANDFPARAELIADEIAASEPDLIGLQEVSLYRVQNPSDYVQGNTSTNATTVVYDYLEILLDALEARGLNYVVAANTQNADVELPGTFEGNVFFDVRLTDRDVILARQDVQTSERVEMNFPTDITATVDVGGQTLAFTRGFNSVRATIQGTSFTFVNAHLEVDNGTSSQPTDCNPPELSVCAQFAQANFLLERYSDDSPKIIVGDFNSDANGSATPVTVPDLGTFTTYGLLTTLLAGGGTDAFSRVNSGTGNTCCYSDDLMGGTLTQRIDLILYTGMVTPLSASVIGTSEQTDGRFASDHAGVVATLRVSN